jgi:hypothetical protein
VGEWISGSDGTGGAEVPPAGDRPAAKPSGAGGASGLGRYAPEFPDRVDIVDPADVAGTGPRINGEHKINGERRTEPADTPAHHTSDGKPRPLSVHEVNERIYQNTGLPMGLPSYLDAHRDNSTSTKAGRVFADRATFLAAASGTQNIVSDAEMLRAEPGSYVFQSSGAADLLSSDVGLLVLADPYYHDGTDIKLTFPASEDFRESVAGMTQARVFAPPEGYLARADSEGNLVIAASDQYGYGGPPYPSGNASEWLQTAPPEPGY